MSTHCRLPHPLDAYIIDTYLNSPFLITTKIIPNSLVSTKYKKKKMVITIITIFFKNKVGFTLYKKKTNQIPT